MSLAQILPTVIGNAEGSYYQLVVQKTNGMSSQAQGWNVGHDPIALAVLSKHLHLPCLGNSKGNSFLALEFAGSVWFVVANDTTDYWGQVGRVARITNQSTLESLGQVCD